MGKQKRNEYLKLQSISMISFIDTEQPINANGIKAIPRKNTDDYTILFTSREKELKPHLVMNNGETFVDVGANVGYYTLKAATEYGNNNIKIVAIEAHPDNYRALCRNIAYNRFNNVILVNKAALDTKGMVTLYECINSKNHFIAGKTSIYLDADSKLSPLQVETDTIDNILEENNVERVDVLKMDIEGAEVLALKGAIVTLRKLRKIVVEVHGDKIMEEVKSILMENNFDVKVINLSGHGYAICDRLINHR
jgi:FkbM family methyltransferase